MKTTKTLQMRVIVAVFYSTNLFAQGSGWDFTYLAPQSEGVTVKYGRGKYEDFYDNNGDSVKYLQQYGNVKTDTLLLDSSQTAGKLLKSTSISTANYNQIQQITNTNFDDRKTFGQLQYTGKIAFNDFSVSAVFQIRECIRLSAFLPVFRYTFTNSGYTDLTPATGSAVGIFNPTLTNADWKAFLEQYANILAGYGLKADSYTQSGAGDLRLDITFTDLLEQEGSLVLDAKVGLVTPTGKSGKLDQVVSFDFGHKKQWGALLGTVLRTTHDEYVQFEAGANAIFFKDKVRTIRMYTDEHQSSFIKLGQGKARSSLGTKWNFYSTVRFSKPEGGLAVVMGYACNGQAQTYLYPEDVSAFKDYIVNTDPELQKWRSHTIFGEISYVHETSNECCDRVMASFLVDYPFAGKNTVKGVRYGGSCGIVVKFDF